MKSTVFNSDITPPFQDFFPRETNFHFYQFLFNFLRYSFSNFLLFHPYNIFAIYFTGSSSLLKSYSSTKSNFSYFLTFTSSLSSNSATAFFTFFKIFSTSYSSTSSTSTSFTSSTFCSSTCSLYLTT